MRELYDGKKRIAKIPPEVLHAMAKHVSEGKNTRKWVTCHNRAGGTQRICVTQERLTNIVYWTKAADEGDGYGGFLQVTYMYSIARACPSKRSEPLAGFMFRCVVFYYECLLSPKLR